MVMTPEERLDRIEKDIEKQNEGIRGLIVLARTSPDSIQEMRQRHDRDHSQFMADMEKLREATASKLRLTVTAKKAKTFVLDTNLRGAEDMPCGVQRHRGAPQRDPRPVLDRRQVPVPAQALPRDTRSGTCENVAGAAVA